MNTLMGEGGRADIATSGAPGCSGFGEEGGHDAYYDVAPVSGAPSIEARLAALDQYRGTGHELIRLRGSADRGPDGRSLAKVPPKGWTTTPALPVENARTHLSTGSNVGVRLRPVDLVLDVDPRHFSQGDDPLARLSAALQIDLTEFPTVQTGGGGRHIYMLKPAELETMETHPDYPGLEFKTSGRQVVAAGSIHSSGRDYSWDTDPLAVSLRHVAAAPSALLTLLTRPHGVFSAASGSRTPEELEAMLTGLDVLSYNHDQGRWLSLMMAAHDATCGAGREQWIAWCTGDPDYAGDDDVIGRRWDSLNTDKSGGKVTEATLFKALLEAGRGDLVPPRDVAEDFPDDLALDDPRRSINDWVWVVDAEQFVRRSDGKKLNTFQWRSIFAPLFKEGDVVSAVFKDKLPMMKFERLVSIPGLGEFPDGVGRGRYNIWRPSGITPVEGDVSLFLDHMEYLVPDATERSYVLDYMAQLVQHPAEKVHFALLMQGVQGTGKSWLGNLMEMIIGPRNVVRPSNDEVGKSWTVWMEGHQLALIEELMAGGKLDVANRLKPVITDGTIRIEEKGRSHYTVPNHLNLLCFTNHEDALKLESGDRRWLVVFSPAVPKEPAYYVNLFKATENGPLAAAVSHWLRQRTVTLDVKSVAPFTAGKSLMLGASMDDVEAYIREQVDERAAPFQFDLIRLEDVLDALPGDLRGGPVRNRVTRALRTVGAINQKPRYTKGDRPSYSLWSLRDHDVWQAAGATKRIDAYMAAHSD